MKVIFKGCPRCNGDLVPDRYGDGGGRDMCCVQCGYEAPYVLVSRQAPVLVSSQPMLAVPAMTAGTRLRVA